MKPLKPVCSVYQAEGLPFICIPDAEFWILKSRREIEGFENLPKLFVTQTEKMMDKFNGSVKELRGLFKIPKTNIQTGS